MTNYQLNGSIQSNTARIVSPSQSNWGTIRPGSFIKFDKDIAFYNISKIQSFFYSKEFEVIDANCLKIKDNVGVNLFAGDMINIFYREKELLTLLGVKDGGKGYRVGEEICVVGGEPTKEIRTGLTNYTAFTVTEVGPIGDVKNLQLSQRGKYAVSPQNIVECFGGSGSGVTLELEFKYLHENSLLERTISAIEFVNDGTRVYLDYSLPKGVDSGKLSVEKWEMFLTTLYQGQNKINQGINILRDFTQHLGLPFLSRGSFSTESIYNISMNKIDAEIAALKQEMIDLKAELKALRN